MILIIVFAVITVKACRSHAGRFSCGISFSPKLQGQLSDHIYMFFHALIAEVHRTVFSALSALFVAHVHEEGKNGNTKKGLLTVE